MEPRVERGVSAVYVPKTSRRSRATEVVYADGGGGMVYGTPAGAPAASTPLPMPVGHPAMARPGELVSGHGLVNGPAFGQRGGGFSRTRLRPCMTTAWRGRPHHHRWATGLPRHRRCRHLKRSKLRHRRHRLRHRRRPSDCRSRCGCRRDRMCAPWPRTDRQVLVSGEWLRDR